MDNAKRARIDQLVRRAELLEKQAADREDSAATSFGIGSSFYVRAFDTADGYRAEARELRAEAMQLRLGR